MAMPFGYAFGYGFGGVISSSHIYSDKGDNESWRAVFILECIIMIPLACALFFMKSPRNMLILKDLNQPFVEETPIDFPEDDLWHVKTKRILTNPTWVLITLGYSTQTFVTGTFAVLAIEYLNEAYQWSSGTAGPTFGGMTLISGLFVFFFLLKKKKKKKKKRGTHGLPDHYYLEPTVRLLAWLSLLAFPFALVVFVIDSIVLFIFCAFVAMFLIFASTGPCNNAILWSVLYKDRPLAMAFNTFSIHALGDALAPVLVGFMVQTRYHAGHSKKRPITLLWLLLALGCCSVLCAFFGSLLFEKVSHLRALTSIMPPTAAIRLNIPIIAISIISITHKNVISFENYMLALSNIAMLPSKLCTFLSTRNSIFK
ncbi:transporter [Reticulomyxa filosa]|uniref:Transporter n=1 Tax=Reticulomyxa filosa TaxID=46433 RepID=X6LBJ4_RETFI|nr:transporter [Reticulomyxa filosa]|eukprot:ETN98878.1 transporter [Reticulomyxa filosa]